MSVNYKIIGNRIQLLRKSRCHTQEQMAEALNVTPGYISQIERGITRPNLDMLGNISQYLECDMGDIVYQSQSPTMSFYEDDICHDYERLTPQERRILSYLLKTYIEKRN